MNLANKITILRVLMVPVFLVLMYIDTPNARLFAAILFIIASITDSIDGYIARTKNMVTTFGKFADPLADKILALSALIVLAEFNEIPGWVVVIVMSREFAVSGLRIIAASSHVMIAASKWGKIKTLTQLIGISLMLLNFNFLKSTYNVALIIVYISVVFTIISGVDYFSKNRKVFNNN